MRPIRPSPGLLLGVLAWASLGLSMEAGQSIQPENSPSPPSAGQGQTASAAALKAICAEVPAPVRDRTHLFFINGCDPLCIAQLNELCGMMKELGYRRANFGQCYATRSFYQQIRQIKAAAPDARIVLVGYSLGANRARALAQWLNQDGIAVDLLMYLGADLLPNDDRSRPANVLRVTNISGHTLPIFGGELLAGDHQMQGAHNVHLDAGHFCLPCQPGAVEALVRELVALGRAPAP
jgi:hypothetical protein